MRLRLFALLAMGLVCLSHALAAESVLVAELSNVRGDRGQIRVGLYQDAKTFRKELQAFSVQQIPAKTGVVTARFTDVPEGHYAIMAYHDEDDSGKLNLRLGMFPTEGYGLSNNPDVLGPPQFADSVFFVTGAETNIRITLRY